MSEELNALLQNSTWTLVPPSPSHNIIGSKWVYHIKRHLDGSITRYRTQLVAKGFDQRSEEDFTENIHLVLAIAVSQGWSLCQLDVNNAFLQSTLNEYVFMQQPPGFVHSQFLEYVYKLKKVIFGLRQAPHAWYNELRSFLLANGFSNSHCDTSLFIWNNSTVTLYLLVYVDNLIITGYNDDVISLIITTLSSRFSLKDLGALSFFFWTLKLLAHPLVYIFLNTNIFRIFWPKLRWVMPSLLALPCILLISSWFTPILLLAALMLPLQLISSHNSCIDRLLFIGLLLNVFFTI